MIDKNLFADLKAWMDGKRPKYQFIKYINCKNRELTDATIRRLMYEIDREDEHGEIYTEYFSAESFCRNMQWYFSKVAELYGKDNPKDAKLHEMIDSIPATAGWINLIIGGLDKIADQPKRLDMIVNVALRFAAKRANVILIGSDYRELFSKCKQAIPLIEKMMSVQESDNYVMLGMYEQAADAVGVEEEFEDDDNKTEVLDHYWCYMTEQAEQGGLDYAYFKGLFRRTWEHLMPRMTAETVCRRDLELIRRLQLFYLADIRVTCNCEKWEAGAAQQFANGLYSGILNISGRNVALTDGKLSFWANIDGPHDKCEDMFISFTACHEVRCEIGNIEAAMDKLARLIKKLAYKKTEDEK